MRTYFDSTYSISGIQICTQDFYVAMHMKTPFDNALYLSSLSSNLSIRGYFLVVHISKTNKTQVDDHVIAEATAGYDLQMRN